MIFHYLKPGEKLSLNLLKTRGADFLAASGLSETAKRDAELLLCQAFGISKASFFARNRDLILNQEKEISLYFSFLLRRSDYEPIQYILGKQEFYGFEFKVAPGVLIPRPETELIVDLAKEILKDLPSQVHLAELGVGSGAISLSLAKLWPDLQVDATDLEPVPLQIARENSLNLMVSERVKLYQGDMFSALPKRDYDLLISNPPYIPETTIEALEPDVRKEPRSALSGGPDGLDFYRRIMAEATGFLRPGGFLILEIGWNQAGAVKKMAEQGDFLFLKSLKDGQEIERALLWQRPKL